MGWARTEVDNPEKHAAENERVGVGVAMRCTEGVASPSDLCVMRSSSAEKFTNQLRERTLGEHYESASSEAFSGPVDQACQAG